MQAEQRASATAKAIAAIPQHQTAAPQAALPERKQRISKRLAEGIRAIIDGTCKSQRAAADRVGMNYQHFCEMLKKPHVRVFIEREARQTIAAGTMRASRRLVELVDAGSEHVSLDATKHMLGIAGIKPAADAQVSVNVELKAGFVIDLSEPGRPTIDVTPAREG